jgi:signal transduction histidine kinase
MRNRIDTTLRDAPDAETYRETLIQTIEEADELIRTFNALLSIARLEAGAQVEEFEIFDLAALAADAVELYEPVAESEGITVSLDAPQPAQVKANRQLLAQATANLIDNALKYARPESGDGAITVCVEPGESQVRLIVADNGPGIPEDQRERALKRFARLETSRSRPGSGLGLSLVAAVARLHGGNIVLEDNRPGLRVVITLPAAPDDAGKARA